MQSESWEIQWLSCRQKPWKTQSSGEDVWANMQTMCWFSPSPETFCGTSERVTRGENVCEYSIKTNVHSDECVCELCKIICSPTGVKKKEEKKKANVPHCAICWASNRPLVEFQRQVLVVFPLSIIYFLFFWNNNFTAFKIHSALARLSADSQWDRSKINTAASHGSAPVVHTHRDRHAHTHTSQCDNPHYAVKSVKSAPKGRKMFQYLSQKLPEGTWTQPASDGPYCVFQIRYDNQYFWCRYLYLSKYFLFCNE